MVVWGRMRGGLGGVAGSACVAGRGGARWSRSEERGRSSVARGHAAVVSAFARWVLGGGAGCGWRSRADLVVVVGKGEWLGAGGGVALELGEGERKKTREEGCTARPGRVGGVYGPARAWSKSGPAS